METPRDEKLWKLARKRASFRRHLVSYVVVNTFFWFIWWVGDDRSGTPWPLWCMAGWGMGLAFSYFDAYGSDKQTMAEREYEKLKGK